MIFCLVCHEDLAYSHFANAKEQVTGHFFIKRIVDALQVADLFKTEQRIVEIDGLIEQVEGKFVSISVAMNRYYSGPVHIAEAPSTLGEAETKIQAAIQKMAEETRSEAAIDTALRTASAKIATTGIAPGPEVAVGALPKVMAALQQGPTLGSIAYLAVESHSVSRRVLHDEVKDFLITQKDRRS